MKPTAVHVAWILVAAAAFAAGKYTNSSGSTERADDTATSRVIGAAETGRANTSSPPSTTENTDAISEAKSLVDQFRVSGSGHINPRGMRDAVVAAVREGDPVRSSLMFAMLMEELTPENAQAARDAISETVSGWESFRYIGLLNFKWGAIDGDGAVAAAQESGDRRESFMGTAMALSGWASSDPDAALAWMESQDTGDNRAQGMWMRSLITGLAGSDPMRATELVAEMAQDDPGGAKGYTESIAREMLKKSLGEAEQWLDSLADSSMRAGAIETISRHITRTDPAKALSWASNLDPGDGQNSSMTQIFSDWSRKDPTAASQELTGLPDGTAKDYAITGLVNGTRREDPEAAVAWAATIGDGALRDKTIIDTGADWFRRDQEAAAVWLAGSNLSEQVQTSIIEKSTEQRGFDVFGRGRRD